VAVTRSQAFDRGVRVWCGVLVGGATTAVGVVAEKVRSRWVGPPCGPCRGSRRWNDGLSVRRGCERGCRVSGSRWQCRLPSPLRSQCEVGSGVHVLVGVGARLGRSGGGGRRGGSLKMVAVVIGDCRARRRHLANEVTRRSVPVRHTEQNIGGPATRSCATRRRTLETSCKNRRARSEKEIGAVQTGRQRQRGRRKTSGERSPGVSCMCLPAPRSRSNRDRWEERTRGSKAPAGYEDVQP